jgi:hypothetical protein
MEGKMWKKLGRIGVVVALAAVGVTAAAGIIKTPAMAVDDEEEGTPIIQISPLKERQKLEPGQKYEGSFEIYNRGTKPLDFKVYVTPFSINRDCTENYDVPSDYTKLTEWVTFETLNYYDLPPEEKQVVKFIVDIPKDAPKSNQYVVLFAETVDSTEAQGQAAIGVNERVGYKFYADLGGTNKESGQVESVSQGNWFWESPINGFSTVRNTGNVDFNETHTYTITTLGGKEVYKHSSSSDVLPDTCRKITETWEKTPAFGVFWVENKIEFLGQEQFNKRKLVIVIPVYIVIIFSIMIILLIWALVLKIKGEKISFRKKKGQHKES